MTDRRTLDETTTRAPMTSDQSRAAIRRTAFAMPFAGMVNAAPLQRDPLTLSDVAEYLSNLRGELVGVAHQYETLEAELNEARRDLDAVARVGRLLAGPAVDQ